jgi:uncharacterized protein YutD
MKRELKEEAGVVPLKFEKLGQNTFEYLGKDIKMLPIQFLILEYVFSKKEITKQELIEYDLLVNYNLQFKQSLISSLLGGILIIDGDKIKVNDTDKDFISDNYIDIFFNTSNYKEIWENKLKQLENYIIEYKKPPSQYNNNKEIYYE